MALLIKGFQGVKDLRMSQFRTIPTIEVRIIKLSAP